MKISLYNTLKRKKETFTPLQDKKVGFYTCGPTVYDYAHIGNFRTYIFEDILRRVLESNDYKVNQVMNITDIDDKTIKRSREEKVSLKSLTEKYTKIFRDDIKKLNIQLASAYPKATENIPEITEMIKKLLIQKKAYQQTDGVYFKISSFENYGRLAQLDAANLEAGASGRVHKDEYNKESASDFVLWKAWDKNDGDTYWQTEFGKGRPGWHIECSAMSKKYLGQPFDIHAGAVDLIFPHHENEIAQSESAFGKPMVNYWIHGEHLLVAGKKMAKSSHNFYTLGDILKKGFDPFAFRYLCLETHYRTKMNFTWESLEAAAKTLKNIRQLAYRDEKKINPVLIKKIQTVFNDDLNTPKALALLHQANNYNLWLKFEPILGLGLKKETTKVSVKIKDLIKTREEARAKGDFKTADKIRKELTSKGIKIEDTPDGTKILLE